VVVLLLLELDPPSESPRQSAGISM
jgi:hypothetical protein